MPLTLLIESELDERSATAAANRAERVYADASKNIGKTMTTEIAGGARESSKAIDKMADDARASYKRVGDATDELKAQERQLQQMREDGTRGVEVQAERVRQARKREKDAIKEAAAALDEYDRAAQKAGESGEKAAGSFATGLRGAAGAAKSAGGELAGGFTEGFAGSAALMRLGAAGGPIGLALAGVAALGVTAGKILADNIDQGLASLAMQDTFKARLGADDASMQRYAKAAAGAYTNQFGASVEDNLGAIQFGVQGGLINPGSSDAEIKRTAEQMQSLAQMMNTDVQEVARAGGQMIRAGLADNAEQAMDILAAGSQKGLDIAGDWLDTSTEYATQWRKLGLSGSDAIGLINQGLEGAARDSDIVADSLKEFAIRAVDGSKTTAEGFQALGFNADDMNARFNAGGESARSAFGAVLEAIRATDDPMQQKLIWADLFGTQFEDMGDAINRFDLGKVQSDIGSTDGTIQKLTETLGRNASGWDSVSRNIDVTFNKLKTYLADSDIGRFIGQGLPSFVNDTLFNNDPAGDAKQQLADAQAKAAAAGSQPSIFGQTINPTGPTIFGNVPVPGARTPIVPDADQTSGSKKTSFDPSQYSVSAIPVQGNIPISPLAPGAPGSRLTVDPGKVFDAETSEQSARASVESARVRVLELEASGTATAQDIQAAKAAVQNSERSYLSAEAKLQEAQRGTYEKMEGAAKSFSNGLDQISAGIDADFGISKGLPGIADNLVRFLGSLALAGPMAQMAAQSAANPNQGFGLMGFLGSTGAFGSQYTPAAIAAAGGGGYGSTAYSGSPATYGARAVMGTGPGQLNDTGSIASGPQSQNAAAIVQQLFGSQLRGSIGGSRDTGTAKNTHDTGTSIDIPIGPDQGALGDQIEAYLQQHAQELGLKYTIWRDQGKQVDGGRFTTPGHQNHIDAHFNGQPGAGGGGGSGPVPVTVTNGSEMLSGFNWDAVAAKESSGNWQNNDTGGNGHYGGLQFSPSTWNAYGGQQFASMPNLATPDQQKLIADRTAFTGYNGTKPQGLGAWEVITNGSTAPAGITVDSLPPGAGGGGGPAGMPGYGPSQSVGFGGSPLGPMSPPGAPGAASGGIPGMGAATGGYQAGQDPYGVAAGTGGASGGGGIGITPGGTIDTALNLAAAAVPGMGAAAQTGMKLASRAIQFGGQVAAIGVEGLMQTFLPAGSEKAGASWLARGVGGFAGAKPALPNLAGKAGGPPTMQPGQGQPQGAAAGGQGGEKAGNTYNTTVNSSASTIGGAAQDAEFHQSAQNQGPGGW